MPTTTKQRRTTINRLQDLKATELGPEATEPSIAETEIELRRIKLDHARNDVREIPLGSIERHPRNRTISESDPDVVSLAASISQHGQLEPCRVRELGGDRYQLISGERRVTALTLAGIYAARCLVVKCDEATALAEVAVANSERKDLDPIERAELMVELMKPKSDGGSGLSREQAGRIFGLTSESGCKNALRLLKLPKSIRELLRAGKLPERAARVLVPYCEAAPIVAEIEEIVSQAEEAGDLDRLALDLIEGDCAYELEGAIEKHSRPIDLDVKHSYPYPQKALPRLFELTPELEANLEIVSLPTDQGWDAKTKRRTFAPRRYALNVKLWDKLQAPLLEAARAKDSKSSKSLKKRETTKQLTPAELAAEERRKKQEAKKRLAIFTLDWKSRLLRCSIASRSDDSELVSLTLPWLCSIEGYSYGPRSRAAFLRSSFGELGLAVPRSKDVGRAASLLPALRSQKARAAELAAAYWRGVIWPVSRLIGDRRPATSSLTDSGSLPDELVAMSSEDVEALATLAGVSVETGWKAATVEGSDERRLVAAWLLRHTKDQLGDLARELRKALGVEIELTASMNREAIAEAILRAHKPGRPLGLPASLQPTKATKKEPKQ